MKEYQQLSWLGTEKHTAARESLVLKAVTVPVDLTNLDVKHRCKFLDCAASGDEVFFRDFPSVLSLVMPMHI